MAIQPTEADRAALAAIVDLTQQNKGRPPTLAGVTEALGFPSNSRGNIQRQLTRLRPRYVTWTTSPRSLTVTPEGVALICADVRRQGEGPRGSDGLGVQGRIQHPISDAILILLASGLTQLVADAEENGGRRLAAPYRRDWQRAVNQLAAACMQEGVVPPGELVAVPPGGVALVVWSCVLWARLRPAELPVSLPLAS